MNKPDFAVSEFTTWHLSFEEDIELYKKLAVDAIEICERKLSRDLDLARAQLSQVKKSKLRVSSIQPRVHALFPDSMTPDISNPKKRIAEYKNSIDLFSEFFPNTPMVTISGNAPDYNYRYAFDTALELYTELADYAAGKNMQIMFEPLNPILMNNDSFICSLEDALELIQKINRDNFGLMLDIWHIWHEPLIFERIADLNGLIMGVHISDWSAKKPRAVADRLIPGEGIIDIPKILKAIERSGYKDAYCLEIFSADHLADSLWQIDPSELIEKSRAGFFKAWEQRNAF